MVFLFTFSLRLLPFFTILLANPLYKRYLIFSLSAPVLPISWSFSLSTASDLFSFHSRYSFSIGVVVYLALEVWFPCLQSSYWWSTLFSSFTAILPPFGAHRFSYGNFYPLCSFRSTPTLFFLPLCWGFGSLCLARHYYTNLSWFLFLLLLRCFSSQSLLPYVLFS